MNAPERALIIDEPWISHILAGEKTWEMRSRAVKVRGLIALIRKGSGRVVGTVELVGSTGPFTREQMLAHQSKHCIPTHMIESGAVDNWNHAWELQNAKPLREELRYRHPNGAVSWVKLEADVRERLQGL